MCVCAEGKADAASAVDGHSCAFISQCHCLCPTTAAAAAAFGGLLLLLLLSLSSNRRSLCQCLCLPACERLFLLPLPLLAPRHLGDPLFCASVVVAVERRKGHTRTHRSADF